MLNIGYIYSKFFKKILRGKSILNSKIHSTAKIYSGTSFSYSSLGRYSYIGYDCEIMDCEIGNFCSIANGCIVGGAQHPLHWVSTSPVFYNVKGGTGKHLGELEIEPLKRTIIGHDVWIGNRVTIMQGVKIGTGAVIGAGAVVTKDVEPYSIVAGVPAKHIKYRFSDNMRAELLDSKWWELEGSALQKAAFAISNPELFLIKINKHKNN